MNRLLSTLRLFLILCPVTLSAQVFVPVHDTFNFTYSGSSSVYVHNFITVTEPDPVVVVWKVIDEDFSSDPTWIADSTTIGICDNHYCYTNNGQQLLNGTSYTATYPATFDDMFDVSFNLSNANPGTHFVKIQLKHDVFFYDTTVTYLVNKWPTGITVNTYGDNKVIVYPNPATNDINVSFDNTVIKSIGISDIAGKSMVFDKVCQDKARFHLDSFTPGVYFIQMYDDRGYLVNTRRFTKQ